MDLIFESFTLGSISRTKLCIGYIRGLCSSELINEVRNRLNKISADNVTGSNYIEEQINDSKLSVFPQVRSTDRPDAASAALMEGRVVVIVDNTPVVLIIPGEFFSLLQSADDYYNRFTFSSLISSLMIMPPFYRSGVLLLKPVLYRILILSLYNICYKID
jgi:spore germination protein KA